MENVSTNVKMKEEKKAFKAAVFLSVIFTIANIIAFELLFKKTITNVEPINAKFFVSTVIYSILLSLVLIILQKVINAKYYIRDKKSFRQTLIFAYLVYVIGYLVFLAASSVSVVDNAELISAFFVVNGIIVITSLLDYDISNMGIYTEDFDEFIFYELERSFIFKDDLTESTVCDTTTPIEELTSIIKEQTQKLPLKSDLKNIGKYCYYFIKKYDDPESKELYIAVCYSHTGKRCDDVISINHHYDHETYEKKLLELNNMINVYLRKE